MMGLGITREDVYFFQRLKSLSDSTKKRRSQLCQPEKKHRQRACEDIETLVKNLENELDALGVGQLQRSQLIGRDNEQYKEVRQELQYFNLALFAVLYGAERLRLDNFRNHYDRRHVANAMEYAIEYIERSYEKIVRVDTH